MPSSSQRWLSPEKHSLEDPQEDAAYLEDHSPDLPQDDQEQRVLQTLMAPDGAKKDGPEAIAWLLGSLENKQKAETRFVDVHDRLSAYKDENIVLKQTCSEVHAQLTVAREHETFRLQQMQRQCQSLQQEMQWQISSLQQEMQWQISQYQVLQAQHEEHLQQQAQQQQLHLQHVGIMEAQLSYVKDELAKVKSEHAEVLEDERCEHHGAIEELKNNIEELKYSHKNEIRLVKQQHMNMQSELLAAEEEKHRFATHSIELVELRRQNVILTCQKWHALECK